MSTEEQLPNRCPNHPEAPKEFYCEVCKTFFCMTCYKNDKNHKQKISSVSETLMENYEFLKYLGGGAFGKVFKVQSLSDGQELALKVVQDVDDETFVIAKKESQFLCSLNHKNIVKYTYSYRIKEEQLFVIIMELAEDSLYDKIPTLTQEKAFDYFKQICEGLGYLHLERGVIHRDLKPGNILLKGDEIKICDLGEAKKMTKEHTKLTNKEGYGTECYLPPEVLSGKDYGFKADIWALGIIFHKMLTKEVHPMNPTGSKSIDIRQSTLDNQIVISESITNPLYLQILKGFLFIHLLLFYIWVKIGCLAYEEKDRMDIKELLEIIHKTGFIFNFLLF